MNYTNKFNKYNAYCTNPCRTVEPCENIHKDYESLPEIKNKTNIIIKSITRNITYRYFIYIIYILNETTS